MTTVPISNEPITGKPRQLNITLNGLTIGYSVDLLDTDGSMISQGIGKLFQSADFTLPDSPEKDALTAAVLAAFETYYLATN